MWEEGRVSKGKWGLLPKRDRGTRGALRSHWDSPGATWLAADMESSTIYTHLPMYTVLEDKSVEDNWWQQGGLSAVLIHCISNSHVGFLPWVSLACAWKQVSDSHITLAADGTSEGLSGCIILVTLLRDPWVKLQDSLLRPTRNSCFLPEWKWHCITSKVSLGHLTSIPCNSYVNQSIEPKSP